MHLTPGILEAAKKIWDYHHMHHELQKADCILALGSHDLRVGDWAADLYLQGWAPLLIVSGGLGRLTKGSWNETEGKKFARVAVNKGVPEEAILIEDRSTNTGENILFTQELLHSANVHPGSFIVVQKPYMERRSFATFEKVWPGKKIILSSPPLTFEQYASGDMDMEKVIHIMVGDLQRIRIYPSKGFQVEQHIPEDVWSCYELLVKAGFDKQLVRP
jgi:uncharacterized SAM-binding protein YcdF (DUF218 family)